MEAGNGTVRAAATGCDWLVTVWILLVMSLHVAGGRQAETIRTIRVVTNMNKFRVSGLPTSRNLTWRQNLSLVLRTFVSSNIDRLRGKI